MRAGVAANEWKIVPLSGDGVTVGKVAGEDKIHLGRPSILALPGGRIVVAYDQLGMGVRHLPGHKGQLLNTNHWLQGRILVSNDKGVTWSHKADFPFCQPCLFRDGNSTYVIGHRGNIQIMRSADGGETWQGAEEITSKEGVDGHYVLGAPNVLAANGSLYLVMMSDTDPAHKGAPSSVLSPVVLRASQGADLTKRRAWTVSEPLGTFGGLVAADRLDYDGIPFYNVPDPRRGEKIGHERWANRIGWGETHLLQILDPAHGWRDPGGRAVHVVTRADVHRTNIAIFARLEEEAPGKLKLAVEATPAGKRWVFLPVPGGHRPFDIVYDDVSKLYWLVSNQSTDSMTRAAALPRERFGLPSDESHRLQLCFSKNLVDWCFAGLITSGVQPMHARQSPSMAIRGPDLLVVTCAGSVTCRSAHHPDLITFHAITDFRDLVY